MSRKNILIFLFIYQAMTSESSEVFESVTTTLHADNKQKKTIINSLVMSASSEQSQIVNLPEPVIIMYRHKLQVGKYLENYRYKRYILVSVETQLLTESELFF